MKRVIIYGASESGRKIFRELKYTPTLKNQEPPYEVLAFTDSNPELWGKEILGIKIINPCDISDFSYDSIIVAALGGKDEIKSFLFRLSVPISKINTEYVDSFVTSRRRFLLDQAEVIYQNKVIGSVAEVGVWKGEFAKYINAYFPDRTLYLFDTFTSYDKRDIEKDTEKGITEKIVEHRELFEDTSVEYVKSVLPFPEKAVFRPGYFPETAQGIEDKFAFVNLDVNLYSPTLAALEFFYPKMQRGGVILCHDFFSEDIVPASKAINEFSKKYGLAYMAIGDRFSVALLKQ